MSAARRKPSSTVTQEEIHALQNPEAERAVLGEMLESPEALSHAQGLLTSGHFFSPANRTIFETALSLHAKGIPADAVILKDELSRRGELEAVGGPAYIGTLTDAPCGHAGLAHYADILLKLTQRRGLLGSALAVAKNCTNGHTSDELMDAASALYREVLDADPEARRRCRPFDALLGDYAAGLGDKKLRKLRTGLWTLDKATDGIAPGEVLTIVARPQVGKSALACQIIVTLALEGIASILFSLEMPAQQALERLLQAVWNLTRHQVEGLAEAGFKGISDNQKAGLECLRRNVAIIDRGKSSVTDLDASMMEAAAILQKDPAAVAVDYLGLLGSGARNLAMYQRISEAAVDLKSFAKRHHVALVLLSQAGRDTDEGRSEGWKELGLDAARDSGQVEEAADFLLTLWRPELRSGLSAEAKADVRGDLEGRLCKNRRGPRPYLHFHLDEARQRITDTAEEATE